MKRGLTKAQAAGGSSRRWPGCSAGTASREVCECAPAERGRVDVQARAPRATSCPRSRRPTARTTARTRTARSPFRAPRCRSRSTAAPCGRTTTLLNIEGPAGHGPHALLSVGAGGGGAAGSCLTRQQSFRALLAVVGSVDTLSGAVLARRSAEQCRSGARLFVFDRRSGGARRAPGQTNFRAHMHQGTADLCAPAAHES